MADFGLYVHWPFCQAKCPYCDFNSHVVDSIDQDRWRRAYLAEIERCAGETGPRVLKSIFFGGGTPSLMEPETVSEVIAAARSAWTPSNDIEITLEANPTSIEAERFRAYADGGVNRVSVGVQALNDSDLKNLGRLHTVDEALHAVSIARDAFERVSFDIIYARQDQDLKSWRRELTQALAMKPDHLSLYQLTIEDGTAFGDRAARGLLPGLPDEDLGADMYELTQELTEAAGLPGYEISNHAKPGAESRHNLIYWQSGEWVGVGPGAHGRLNLDGCRFATETHTMPLKWLSSVEDRGTGEIVRRIVDPEDASGEGLFMGLRLRTGVPYGDWLLPYNNKINDLVEIGMLELSDDHLRATSKGRPVLNAVLSDLLY